MKKTLLIFLSLFAILPIIISAQSAIYDFDQIDVVYALNFTAVSPEIISEANANNWLLEIANGPNQPISILYGVVILKKEGVILAKEEFIKVSGAGGSERFLLKSAKLDADGTRSSFFWSAKKLVGNKVVSDVTPPIKSLTLLKKVDANLNYREIVLTASNDGEQAITEFQSLSNHYSGETQIVFGVDLSGIKEATGCSDSDNSQDYTSEPTSDLSISGMDKYVRGFVDWSISTSSTDTCVNLDTNDFVDSCIGSDYNCGVQEYFCSTVKERGARYIECPDGCNNGACLSALMTISSENLIAGETLTITITPTIQNGALPKGVINELGIFPWYLFDSATGKFKGMQIEKIEDLCSTERCTTEITKMFTIPENWVSGKYYLSLAYVGSNNVFQNQRLEFHVTNLNIVIDEGECKSVISNGPSEDKLDVVFLADNYDSTNIHPAFDDAVNKFINEGIFATEPFKSNTEKMNFWRVDRLGSVRPSYATEFPGPMFWEDMLNQCGGADLVVVVEGKVMPELVGAVAFARNTPPWLLMRDYQSAGVFMHELGHAFGSLGDEYSSSRLWGSSNDPVFGRANIDVMGCPKWCSGQPNESASFMGISCWGAWQKFNSCITQIGITISTCWDQAGELPNGRFVGMENCNFGTSCQTGTGCYWNAKATNTFKPTTISIMNNAIVEFGYGPVSEAALLEKLNLFK